MKPNLATLAVTLSLAVPAVEAATYDVTPGAQTSAAVRGQFEDVGRFCVGAGRTAVHLRAVDRRSGGSGRGGGYRSTSLATTLSGASMTDARGNVIGELRGGQRVKSGTFELDAGCYRLRVSGAGTGTHGNGRYTIKVETARGGAARVP